MDIMQAMAERHSVRQYTGRPIEGETLAALEGAVADCARESGLSIQLVTGEPEAFAGGLARYGSFRGVQDYIVLVGRKGPELEERCGYYGQKLVLLAQLLGLNTCWVALTFSKRKARIRVLPGEKLVCVIAVGYGVGQGLPHKNRPIEELYRAQGALPDWFRRGLEAAMLAPTAVNQQKFLLTLLEDRRVKAEATGGFYSQVDLGIVKYHFELGAAPEIVRWAD